MFYLFSDEAKFSNNGGVIKNHLHYYSPDNPPWIRQGHFQTVYSTNIWCGILNNQIIGPHFFRGNLKGNMYLNFLQNDLPLLLEDIDLETRQNLWYQQDEAPPHFRLTVREYLNERFEDRWIGRGSVNPWHSEGTGLLNTNP